MERTFWIITYVVGGMPYTTIADTEVKRDMARDLLVKKGLDFTMTTVTASVTEDWGPPQLHMLVSVSA